VLLACFFPFKPGKDGLPFPSQAVVLTPSGQYETNKAKLERCLVPASAFTSYGKRENTLYEHLDEFLNTSLITHWMSIAVFIRIV
jgi:hypothetical protein